MCKVLKSYGVIAEHGNKLLTLQTIVDGGERTLSLVSYKDGMSVANRNLSREDASKLFDMLSVYLDYKPEVEIEPEESENGTDVVETNTETKKRNEDVIKVLTTLPALDSNYTTILKIASAEDIQKAIEQMKKSGGRHGTRIKACETQLKRLSKGKSTEKTENKPQTEAEPKVEEKKPEPKIVTFPTEDKKPKIIPLHTEGERTYGECVAKLKKEAEQFKDADSEYVITGLIELAKVDQDFRNNLMREDKSYGGFMEFMFKAAQDGYCVRYGNVGWLDRDTALGLAIDYFNHDSVKEKEIEDAKKAEQKAKAEANKKEAKKDGSNNRKKKGRVTA